jgi:hypothetical protein
MGDELEPKVWAPSRSLPSWWLPPDWDEEARIRREQEREQLLPPTTTPGGE